MADDKNQKTAVFDTDQQYLGGVYAKALLGMADKSGNVAQVLEELHSFVQLLADMPKLRRVLESSRIPFADKERIVEQAIKGKASPQFLNFVKVVCRKGRAGCFSAIAESAQTIQDERTGSVQAVMTTAVAVDDKVRKKVADQLSTVLGKKVSLSTNVDASIIGGLVVRVGDTVYDGSVTNQLSQVRKTATENANHQIRKSLDRFTSND